ncbi:MAG: hypothetical protein WCZ66_11440 [Sphingomonadaceae bacterium]
MTEGQALLLATGGHLLLLAVLSFGLIKSLPPTPHQPDITPIDYVEIGPEPTVTEAPKPSMDAAPREPEPPAPAPEPVLQPAPPEPVPDISPQDVVIEEPEPQPKPKPKPEPKKPAEAKAPLKKEPLKKPETFNAGQMAALIDKNLPDAPARPRDVSAFAKSIESALPKGARISPRQIATLEQAIRSQIAPCWNPPMGGADVAEMTVVLQISLNRDGSIAAPPKFVSQTGATAGNQAYARAFVETAKRAVLRCAPLSLPADLYAHWREFELNFDPRLMT